MCLARDRIGDREYPVAVVIAGCRRAVVGVGDGQDLRRRRIGRGLHRLPGRDRRAGEGQAGIVLPVAADIVIDRAFGGVEQRGGAVMIGLGLAAVGVVEEAGLVAVRIGRGRDVALGIGDKRTREIEVAGRVVDDGGEQIAIAAAVIGVPGDDACRSGCRIDLADACVGEGVDRRALRDRGSCRGMEQGFAVAAAIVGQRGRVVGTAAESRFDLMVASVPNCGTPV